MKGIVGAAMVAILALTFSPAMADGDRIAGLTLPAQTLPHSVRIQAKACPKGKQRCIDFCRKCNSKPGCYISCDHKGNPCTKKRC